MDEIKILAEDKEAQTRLELEDYNSPYGPVRRVVVESFDKIGNAEGHWYCHDQWAFINNPSKNFIGRLLQRLLFGQRVYSLEEALSRGRTSYERLSESIKSARINLQSTLEAHLETESLLEEGNP